ncbi:MAG: carcinine hydrolase/isopenicillin-N N-acyltransferase family protein [Bacteroidaceae bacterium]|nr:carcinine hydrolase/isopenicillin-N N-acyltransferase family protein [Bacteroidaceae bacterium]
MAFKQYNEAPVIENLTGEEKVYINDGNSFKQASIKDIVAQGSKKNDYLTIKKIKDYLFETHYGVIDYGNAYAYFASQADPIDMGACSAARNGNWYGRNLDWTYDENAEFIVHTPHIAGRYASIAVAGGIPGLTNDVVISEEYNALYKIVPFRLYDGINEHGVIINMNVVPTDNGTNVSIPTEQEEVTISAQMLVRYVLDYFKTASEAVDYIQKHMKIYFSNSLHDHNYELHFMVADEEKTYLVEFAENAAIVVDMSDDADSNIAGKAYMTNFYLNDITLNDDDTVYTPGTQTADYNAKDTNGITDCGAGLERYNYIVDAYDSANTKDGMRAMMNGLKYTRTYSTAPDAAEPVWLTEYVGVLGLTVISDPEDFDAVVQYAGGLFNDRTRTDGLTWQTVHSAVYDIENRALNIIVQEDGEELEFALDGFERKDNPEPVVLPHEVENAVATHGMGWTDEEVKEGFDIQWDGNTEGLERVPAPDADLLKISDLDIPNDQLIGLKFDITDSNIHEVATVEITEEFFDELKESGRITNDFVVVLGLFAIVRKDGIDIGGSSFIHKGIYAFDPEASIAEGIYVSRLYKEASTEEVVHQIAQKYIPQKTDPIVENAMLTGGIGWTEGEVVFDQVVFCPQNWGTWEYEGQVSLGDNEYPFALDDGYQYAIYINDIHQGDFYAEALEYTISESQYGGGDCVLGRYVVYTDMPSFPFFAYTPDDTSGTLKIGCHEYYPDGANFKIIRSPIKHLISTQYLPEDAFEPKKQIVSEFIYHKDLEDEEHIYLSSQERSFNDGLGSESTGVGTQVIPTTDDAVGAHAEGCIAIVIDSTDGEITKYPTIASARGAHAEGSGTLAAGTSSHAEGYRTVASGKESHAEGSETEATAPQAHAEGSRTNAWGDNAHAEGNETTASGESSHTEGYLTAAAANQAHAEGNHSYATGKQSHAEGYATTAGGDWAHSEGCETVAAKNGSHAEGYKTKVNGLYAHAEGDNTKASGESSHAEGSLVEASGTQAHAEGRATHATNNQAHAEGNATTASGKQSHAEGYNTTAGGNIAHAEGHSTVASGDHSHTEGKGTIAGSPQQHAQGRFNKVDADDNYALIIGNGTDADNRHNCFMVGWDGAIYVQASDDPTKMMKLEISSTGLITATSVDN